MRIATWNVNSVRARRERVIDWLHRADVDVLAMQETKCRDDQFPFEAFEAAGYEVAHWGLNQWNGVALASRVGLTDVQQGFPGQPGFAKEADGLFEPPVEARALGVTVGQRDDATRIWSLYIPNGRTLDDPHYQYKLEWLAALRTAAAGWLAENPDLSLALMGDWNVAPLDEDVWDMAYFSRATHVSPPERAAFEAFESLPLTEISRVHLPEPHTYTYWDYKNLSFPKNFGMRIDFAYVSSALADRVETVQIDRQERKGKGASDHVPVILTLRQMS